MKKEMVENTTALCPHCLRPLTARRVWREDGVVLERECPEHGFCAALIWQDGGPIYRDWVKNKRPPEMEPFRPPQLPLCPYACGLCPGHAQTTCSAIINVTERCSLACPVCLADSSLQAAADPELAVIENQMRSLLKVSGLCNLQFSGGEPTEREDLPEIVALAAGFGFPHLQLNTNGLRLAAEPELARRLRQAGLNAVFLQFDGVTEEPYRLLRGRPLLEVKEAAIKVCGAAGLGVVLVPTVLPGVNTEQLGEILRFALERLPVVRGVHFQPFSRFGRFPSFARKGEHLTLPRLLQLIGEQTGGVMKPEDFFPPACEHPACSFHGTFIKQKDGSIRSLGQPPGSCSCRNKQPTAADGARQSKAFVANRWVLWKDDKPPEKADGWERFLKQVRENSLTVTGMAFMDAWNMDLERLRHCCLHMVHRDGRVLPFCAAVLTNSAGQRLYDPAWEEKK